MANVTDIPDPGVDELQQRPEELWAPPAIPVLVQGIVRVKGVPNRLGNPFVTVVSSTTATHVAGYDPARAVLTLIGDAAWRMHSKRGGTACPIPANVPIVLTHCDDVWASVATGSCNLTAIPEMHAD